MSDNGKWQLGFWLFSTICGVWLLALTTNVVANDRLRSTEDQKIWIKIADNTEKQNEVNTQILVSLQDIKTTLKTIGK